jgi:uroporphyrinogen-III synthase
MFFVRGPKTSGRVQQMIPQEQRSPLICYDTAPVKTKLDFKPEVVVFSSPSNAEAFLISNKWERDMKAVAFGNTTALALENLGIMPVQVSENTDENSLLKAIFVALGV